MESFFVMNYGLEDSLFPLLSIIYHYQVIYLYCTGRLRTGPIGVKKKCACKMKMPSDNLRRHFSYSCGLSGYRDSNPGLPTPEAGALTGLRYTPNELDAVFSVSIQSGYQDSNLGPPAPKAGALTGLRYTPNHIRNSGTKVILFCSISKHMG